MPRLVRRAPLGERIRAYLDPGEISIWLAELLNGGEWDDFQKEYGLWIGIAMNILFMIAKASSASPTISYRDDVFGDYEGRGSSGWLKYFLWLVSILLTTLSCTNALYAMFRTRSYRLFEQAIETPLPTKSARRVRVDSSPMSSSPIRYLTSLISTETAESRAHPDATRDVWELSVWDPTPICLTLFCLFSPGHLFVYWLFIPVAPLDPSPSVTYVKTISLIALLSFQLFYLQKNFQQQSKDNAVVHRGVLQEYDNKFVHPALNKPVRDVGIQTPTPQRRDSSVMATTEVDAYTPTTVINRGFRTNPNPAYASAYDPDHLTSHSQPQLRPSRSTTPAMHTPHIPASATTTSTQADFSSPIRPHKTTTVVRNSQYRTSDFGSGTGDGGSLGVYSHANSPLKKAASSNFLRDDIRDPREASPRKRDGSPLKRVSIPDINGPPSLAQQRLSMYTSRGAGRRESGRTFQ
ncbi:hypothetical protein EJ05DRAFT_495871 [Pseudovirgaria hyperparasitica]|uniref:DUF2418 domain-containing protein n=1 Tax=Pseudovirgaria hyperparasitica TaxID=470096 RepID=A0A6A6WLY6_9PEZI|nr:uncharacterized protein EJ05DRAFT_495871 [Pseudovirgaria hyperparasitica]KAF2763029.1 hypothetical protein EJ05DRAFT_495871 [Pseudovirgaria hyperparasitica]